MPKEIRTNFYSILMVILAWDQYNYIRKLKDWYCYILSKWEYLKDYPQQKNKI